MYFLAAVIIAFVLVQSVFFLAKAWKQGKKIGIDIKVMRDAVVSSTLFTIAPAIAIVATVITLAYSLGFVLPWIRLSVIGNITYEATAAEAALNSFGNNLSQPVDDETTFAAVAWVMTIGSVFPLVLIPLFLKKLQKKVDSEVKTNAKWADTMSAAAFIGLIAAFIARAVAGAGDKATIGDGAGVLSVIALVVSVAVMLILQKLCIKYKLERFDAFTMPLSMICGMAAVMLFARILPESIAFLEWRG
jgi:hypothetical protein